MQEVLLFAMQGSNGSKDPLEARDTAACFKHVLSCDSDKKVEQWISKTHAPPCYVRSMAETVDSVVWNTMVQDFSSTPQSFACICSWACQDVCLGFNCNSFNLHRCMPSVDIPRRCRRSYIVSRWL